MFIHDQHEQYALFGNWSGCLVLLALCWESCVELTSTVRYLQSTLPSHWPHWLTGYWNCPNWVGSPETALILSHIEVMSDKRLWVLILAAAESNKWLGERAGRSTLVVGTYLQLQLSVWSTEKPILVDPLALNNYDDLVSCCSALSKFLSSINKHCGTWVGEESSKTQTDSSLNWWTMLQRTLYKT